MQKEPVAPGAERWTLVRNARQLLTLRGRAGPRGGPAMAELGVVPKGALLIRNGIIVQAGPTRRVENLAEARDAVEIDATGHIVMPAFVNPDVPLVSAAALDDAGPGRLRLMSSRRILLRVSRSSEEHARYGCVTAGAHTRGASDLRNITRLLRAYRKMQRAPIRIVSVFSLVAQPGLADQITSRWLPSVIGHKLAAIAEITVSGPGSIPEMSALRGMLAAASGSGYTIRLRSPWRLEPAHLELALEAGALAVMAPMDSLPRFSCRLADAGIIRVIPVSDDIAAAPRALRTGIRNGAAIALSSACPATRNMQHVLSVAVGRFGLAPEEAITAMTWNAAFSLRVSAVTGSLEPGKAADLLVIDAGDYRDFARRPGQADVNLVMREGRIVYRRRSSLSID